MKKPITGKRSAVLCEGPDDLWFIAYYLHKTARWDIMEEKKLWKNYKPKVSKRQEARYMKPADNGDNTDEAVIWAVGGKNSYKEAIGQLLEFNRKYPDDPVDSIVVVRDRDDETDKDIFQEWSDQQYFPEPLSMKNYTPTPYQMTSRDGKEVSFEITPVIIPFTEEGAVETLFIRSVEERDAGGKAVVEGATAFVNSMNGNGAVHQAGYLEKRRLVLKAKFSSVIAITNPDHSTGMFYNMVMNCPWQNSPTVKEHFEVIRKSVTSA